MIVEVYSVYDKVAEEFGPLFEAVNEKVAIRSYLHLLKGTSYPGDFELKKLGGFDKKKGILGGLSKGPKDIPVQLSQEYPVFGNDPGMYDKEV